METFLLLCDFNEEPTTTTVSDFCEIYNLKNIIKDKTCLKDPSVPACIDLMTTNRSRSLKHSMVVETGLSDFHTVCITVMKTHYNKQKQSIVKYCKFKNFPNDAFLKDLKSLFSKFDNEKNVPFSSLEETVNKTLKQHAPFKKIYVRTNQIPFINKILSKRNCEKVSFEK